MGQHCPDNLKSVMCMLNLALNAVGIYLVQQSIYLDTKKTI